MTARKVVDASALAAFLFAETDSAEVAARLQDATLLAPIMLDLELAHVAIKKLRRRQITMADISNVFANRRKMKIECLLVDAQSVLDLAVAAGLSAYDASYLLIARQYDAELVTLDKQLNAAFLSPIGRQP